jgi:chemotaxis protein histidine kinase CheA
LSAAVGRRTDIPAPQASGVAGVETVIDGVDSVQSQLLDRMVNQAGEAAITRSRLEPN